MNRQNPGHYRNPPIGWRKYVFLAVLSGCVVMLMAGCQEAAATVSSADIVVQPSVISVVESQIQPPTPAAFETMNVVNIEDTISAWEQSNGSLTVRLFILPEMTVQQPTFELKGEAPADSVVSVNDDVILVSATGQFSVTLTLAEGPNWVDVVVSNLEGESVSFGSAVYYEPDTQ